MDRVADEKAADHVVALPLPLPPPMPPLLLLYAGFGVTADGVTAVAATVVVGGGSYVTIKADDAALPMPAKFCGDGRCLSIVRLLLLCLTL
jgi:hypothetical protein